MHNHVNTPETETERMSRGECPLPEHSVNNAHQAAQAPHTVPPAGTLDGRGTQEALGHVLAGLWVGFREVCVFQKRYEALGLPGDPTGSSAHPGAVCPKVPCNETVGSSKPRQHMDRGWSSFKPEFWNFLEVGGRAWKGGVISTGNEDNFPSSLEQLPPNWLAARLLSPAPQHFPHQQPRTYLRHLNPVLSGEEIIARKSWSDFPYLRMKSLTRPKRVTIHSAMQTKTVLGVKGDTNLNFPGKNEADQDCPQQTEMYGRSPSI